MSFATIYRMTWDTMPINREDNSVSIDAMNIIVDISDTESGDVATSNIISLTPAGNPLVIKSIDNNQDKFTQVNAKQAIIKFLSNKSEGQTMTTFSDSSDNRWLVEAYLDNGSDKEDVMLFKGFLMLSDIQMPFLPDPQEVTLIASDHLALLKDIPLTDDDGLTPTGKLTIGEIVAYCFKKTGLSLEIIVVDNIKHGSGTKAVVVNISASGNQISTTASPNDYFFYPGQRITLSGTASNNTTYTVVSVVTDSLASVATVAEDITTAETAVSATIVDESTGHLFSKIYVDAKTFEDKIGTCQDCYTVLQKIFGERLRCFQHNNRWWIINIDEYDGNPIYKARFDADGAFVEYLSSDNTTWPIGIVENVCHVNRGTSLSNDRPNGLARTTYNYTPWQELVCNIDFSRGTGSSPTGSASETIEQTPECIDFLREGTTPAGLDSSPFAGSTGVLKKYYEYGYEKQRYLASTTAGGFRHYFKMSALPVLQGDIIDISYQFRLATSETITNIYTAHVRLVGDDGFVYDWDYDEPTGVGSWNQKTTSDTIFDNMFRTDWSGADTTEWHNISATSKEMPVSGTIIIRLVNGNSAGVEQWHSGLRIGLTSLINGSYNIYSGQQNTVTRNPSANYSVKRENEVYVSDSPRPTFKGAMFFLSDTVYKLTQGFYTSHAFALGSPPNADYIHQFGYIQVFNVWNQYRNANRIFPSQLLGLLNTDDAWPDLWHKYQLTDTDDNTINRYFILISLEQNWKTMQWTGTFIECYRTDLGHVYSDTFDFKYISKNG